MRRYRNGSMKKFSQVDKQIEEFKKTVEILPSGLQSIDAFLDGGFFKKELVVVGAPTGKGKSLVAGQMFVNIAKQGHRSAYFSLEISSEMIVSRLLGSEANVNPTRIMVKYLDEEDQVKKDEAKARLSVYEEFMYFYDDIYQYELIEKEILTNKYDFVVVDFIQNVMLKTPDEYERLSQISLRLQKLAKKANCCILVVSQLSNQMSRDKRNKDTVEYKGSGSIGTVCDLGFFIEEGGAPDQMMIRLRKNRRGISGQAWHFQVRQPGGLIVAV